MMAAGQSTIADVAPRIARGELRAEKLAEEALNRIAELNPSLNAFITVTAEHALAAARRADKEIAGGRHRGPLHGIPISLKDLIDMQGVPTTAGSRLRSEHVARRDAPVTARLREAGAVIVGKTNLHEFAFGTTNEDSGWGPARNPDRSHQVARWIERRLGDQRPDRHGVRLGRHRHRRIDSHSCGRVRRRRTQARRGRRFPATASCRSARSSITSDHLRGRWPTPV